MKMYLGDMPVNSIRLHTDTDDGTLVPADMQVGIVGYSSGQRVVGTGKAFAFAFYGNCETNKMIPVPNTVNTVTISSNTNAVQMDISIATIKAGVDFSTPKQIATVTVDDTSYPLNLSVVSNFLQIACDKTLTLQVFFGKDNH